MAASGKSPKSMPRRKRAQTIAADYPDDGIAIAKRLDGVDGIRRTATPEFHIGSRQHRIAGNRETQHFPSIRHVRQRRAMRGFGGKNEVDGHAEHIGHRACGVEVAKMHRVEGTAKECPHLQRR